MVNLSSTRKIAAARLGGELEASVLADTKDELPCGKELDIGFCGCKLGENKGFVLGGSFGASSCVGIGAPFIRAAAGATA
jgi:hypothetical protein